MCLSVYRFQISLQYLDKFFVHPSLTFRYHLVYAIWQQYRVFTWLYKGVIHHPYLGEVFNPIFTCYGYVFTTRYIATLGFLPAYFRVLFATRNLDKFFYPSYTCYGYVFTARYIATHGFLPAFFRVLFATRTLDKFHTKFSPW